MVRCLGIIILYFNIVRKKIEFAIIIDEIYLFRIEEVLLNCYAANANHSANSEQLTVFCSNNPLVVSSASISIFFNK